MAPNQHSGAVVVGVDGSDHSEGAVHTAAGLAALEVRRLDVVHAPTRISGTVPHHLVETPPGGAEVAILDHARQIALGVAPGLAVSTEIARDDPRTALEHASRTARAVVVGSRGLGSVRNLLLGSVGLHVALHSRCPALVVRPVAGPGDEGPRRIVVGTSGTGTSAAAMEFAYARAALLGLSLRVVYCVDFHHGLTGMTDRDLEGLLLGRRAVTEGVAGLRTTYPDVDVDFELGRGPAVECLARASAHAGMLVVGAPPRTGIAARPVDPVTRGVVEHARCTVAVVPGSS
ncbi:universal stress protein [Nocardioides guangzhouensis]|uniref:Universal stress protein n=1 Tax=Nocardioides guangzhouensis TaxID=2497878 RepID=A0A4Q4ZHU4_9ACTN|nr:universal stress protein [Nocardioides guangzhouensis]RYP87773.1 universal stress protein [Nocardioides guangzhouensis]